ncbi:unnamed protein product [Aphanomyces euteiches]
MALGSEVEAQIQQAVATLPNALIRHLLVLATDQLSDALPSSPILPPLDDATPEHAQAVKDAYAAFCIFVAEVARENQTRDNTRRWLVDLGFPDNSVDDFSAILEKAMPQIQALGDVSGLELDSIVDVNWRLDHCIRSDTLGNIREPVYFVVLTTQSPKTGLLTPIRFTCTVAQLEEIVYKLQEATQQIDRVTAFLDDHSQSLHS